MGSRVILADDSVTIQKVVGIIFANEGYNLTVVASGDAAIAKAREMKPDVMLVDALMPGKNGYEVCREIRQDPALAHTAILLMTGAFEVVDEQKNRQSGADEFITKPFESQTLIDVTNRLIALTAERLARPAGIAAPPAEPVPAAASIPAPPPLPAAVPPQAAAPAVDDIWATGFDDEPAAEPAASDFFAAAAQPAAPTAPAPAPAAASPIQVAAADDLWGAFDMDEVEAAPATVAAAADDIFSFETETAAKATAAVEDEYVLEEIVFDAPLSAAAPAASGFEPFGEQEISFTDDEPVPLAPLVDDEFGAITFAEPEAPVSAPAFVEPPQPPPVAAPAFVPPPAAPAFAEAGSLDEEQLKALLSRVSRDVIERIVWEVVPDLAETIIKEEIRKLKAGTA